MSLIFAIDFDGTIADTNSNKVRWIARHIGRTDIKPWQCDRTLCAPLIGEEHYRTLSAEIYNREWTAASTPLPGALENIGKLQQLGQIHVVTKRGPDSMAIAEDWLRNHSILPDGMHSSAKDGKRQICQDLGAAMLLDDDQAHIEELNGAATYGILLKDNGPPQWHTSEFGYVRSWAELYQFVLQTFVR